jgi:hypothetical protein
MVKVRSEHSPWQKPPHLGARTLKQKDTELSRPKFDSFLFYAGRELNALRRRRFDVALEFDACEPKTAGPAGDWHAPAELRVLP